MKKLTFSVGEKVRIKGRKGTYRFVRSNTDNVSSVQEIGTGHLISIRNERIHKDNSFIKSVIGYLKALLSW